MAGSTETLERELLNDLQTLHDLIQNDDTWDVELYRALAGFQWHRTGADGGHVSFSWKRAEEIVNAQRARKGRDPLTLAQTGGEGEVTARVENALRDQGWSLRRLDPDVHDDSHVDSGADGPPRGGGRRKTG